MQGLIQNIRSGIITKAACEHQLAKFQADKLTLTRAYMARQMGHDLYTKKFAEINFCVEIMKSIIDKWDDFKLPLKPKPVEELPAGTNGEDESDGQAFSTEG